MLSVVSTGHAHRNHHGMYEKERYINPIGMEMMEHDNGRENELKGQALVTKGSDDDLEEEIRQALQEERAQRLLPPRRHVLHRSSSVNMYRRGMMPSFDSERRLYSNQTPTARATDLSKDSWTTMDSIHSRMDDTRRQWNDSIHSRVSTSGGGAMVGPSKMSIASSSSSTTPSFCSDMEDSTCSFASFGELPDSTTVSYSSSQPTDDAAVADCNAQLKAIRLASQSFTSLDETTLLPQHGNMTAGNNTLLMRQQSMRLKRGPSFRGSLSLIQENNA